MVEGHEGSFILTGEAKEWRSIQRLSKGEENKGDIKVTFLGIIIPSWYLTSVSKGFDVC